LTEKAKKIPLVENKKLRPSLGECSCRKKNLFTLNESRALNQGILAFSGSPQEGKWRARATLLIRLIFTERKEIINEVLYCPEEKRQCSTEIAGLRYVKQKAKEYGGLRRSGVFLFKRGGPKTVLSNLQRREKEKDHQDPHVLSGEEERVLKRTAKGLEKWRQGHGRHESGRGRFPQRGGGEGKYRRQA